jgi:hypothetical protein
MFLCDDNLFLRQQQYFVFRSDCLMCCSLLCWFVVVSVALMMYRLSQTHCVVSVSMFASYKFFCAAACLLLLSNYMLDSNAIFNNAFYLCILPFITCFSGWFSSSSAWLLIVRSWGLFMVCRGYDSDCWLFDGPQFKNNWNESPLIPIQILA